MTTDGKLPLSGDKAYELFISSEPFPLHKFLEEWVSDQFVADPGYIIAVIGAYTHSVSRHDGPRDGTYRPKATVSAELALDKAERKYLLDNAVERVMNNAMRIGKIGASALPPAYREDASVLWQDCTELKPIINKIWWAIQEAVRRA
jgi:hypothetical protein